MKLHAVVIGAGIVGCGTALALARKGWRVTVVERLEGVGLGSTARSSTVVRCHYTRPEAIRLAVEGREVWQRWGQFLGIDSPRAVYREVGVLFLLRRGHTTGAGPESLGMKAEMDAHAIDSRVQMMEYAGVEVELLSARKLRKRFPEFAFPEDDIVGIWEPQSGYVAYPTEAVEDLHEACLVEGIEFQFGATVVGSTTAWETGVRRLTGVQVQISNDIRTMSADAVVNCAGPHSHAVNVALACPLPLATVPQRQFIVEAQWDNPVPLPGMADLASGFYIRPDENVFKVGAVLPQDHVDFVNDPESTSNETAVQLAQEKFLARMAKRVPTAKLSNVQTRIGTYDWTVADSYPLIGPTDVEGYFVAIGTSGAWFKSGPVIGELIAECVHRSQRGDTRTLMTLSYSGLKLDLARFDVGR